MNPETKSQNVNDLQAILDKEVREQFDQPNEQHAQAMRKLYGVKAA